MMKNLRKVLLTATLLAAAGTAHAADWTLETIQTDGTVKYYIYNIGTQCYLNDANGLDETASVLWTVDGNTIKSVNNKCINIWSVGELNIWKTECTYTFYASSSETGGTLQNIEQAADYYKIGNYIEDEYKGTAFGSTRTSHTHYMTVSGASLSADATDVSTNANGQWIFVSEAAYELMGKAMDLADKKAALQTAITEAQSVYDSTSCPAAAKSALYNEIADAQSVYESASVADFDNSVAAINSAISSLSTAISNLNAFVGVLGNLSSAISGAQSFLGSCVGTHALKEQLSDKIDEANTLYNSATVGMDSSVNSTIGELSTIQSTITSLVNYYTATVTQVESGISFLTQDEIDGFNDDLEATVSKDEMLDVAQNLRKMMIARIGTTFVESGSSKDVTALLTNPDFEYGTDEGWYTTDAHSAARSSVVEIGSSISGAHGKYMLESGQYGIYTDRGRYVYTVLTDLPVGSYVASAQMTSIYTSVLNPKVNLTVIITPASFFGGAASAPRREAGDSGITTEQVVNNISSVMDSSNSTIKTVSLPKDSPTELKSSGNLAFDVAEPSSVVLVYHSGINDNNIDETGSYRADNLKLAMTANIWTGVDNVIVDSEDAEEVYYDLQGRRVANPERGIYICNGKKVLVK